MTAELKVYVDKKITHESNDPSYVWEHLAKAVIAKKIHKCTYITRITDRTNYDGTRTVIAYHDNGVKVVYTIPW